MSGVRMWIMSGWPVLLSELLQRFRVLVWGRMW